jgi:hypothetical protein
MTIGELMDILMDIPFDKYDSRVQFSDGDDRYEIRDTMNFLDCDPPELVLFGKQKYVDE